MLRLKSRRAPERPVDLHRGAGEKAVIESRDGVDHGAIYLGHARHFRATRRHGADLYDYVWQDEQVASCWLRRVRSVQQAPWEVFAGAESDERSRRAAESLRHDLSALCWDEITMQMLSAQFFGYAVGELYWALESGRVRLVDIVVRHYRRFDFDRDENLILYEHGRRRVLPVNRFWVTRVHAFHGDEPHGLGLAHWLYWPVFFKRSGVSHWQRWLDRYAGPAIIGKYAPGTSPTDQKKLLRAAQALRKDSAIVVPEGMQLNAIESAQRGAAGYLDSVQYWDDAIARLILGGTMVTGDGSSRAQSEVHERGLQALLKADADLVDESFNQGPARWQSTWNEGEDIMPPRVRRLLAPLQNNQDPQSNQDSQNH